MSVPVYSGPFGPAQAERLLWRAGFGPRPGEAAQYAGLGLDGAVSLLLKPGKDKLKGKPPRDDHNKPIAPRDAYGHDHLWWLDRMVRTTKPLAERMTLIWHDWFATSNDGVGSQKLMLAQNDTFRKMGLGSFKDLVTAVTKDPAMLLWLSGADSTADNPNENYGRELMELFTLGADRPGGYTENDVREQARSLTGWTYKWTNQGPTKFRFDPSRHDDGPKTVFNQTGNWTWYDSPRLCVEHPNHASFFVRKLWSYFIPTQADTPTENALEQAYTGSGYQIRPVVQAILKHPDLYTGQSMTKPPVVYTAGILRALNRTIDTTDWIWLDYQSGQQLFYPPNVAGWDDNRWLDTARFRGRWYVAATALDKTALDENDDAGDLPADANAIYTKAVQSLGSPLVEDGARTMILQFGQTALADAGGDPDVQAQYAIMVYNAMRQLLLARPEAQTS
jgi:uncharacterized protein (DUF1800 family)